MEARDSAVNVNWFGKPMVKLSLFVSVSILALIISFSPGAQIRGQELIMEYGAVLIVSELALLLFLVWSLLRRSDFEKFKNTPASIYFILALLFLFSVSREPLEFKIVNDEIMLSVTAMNIHYNREIKVPGSGFEIEGRYKLVGGYLDKRPAFFPVLLSLVHDIFGYRQSNTFVLNIALTALLIWILFWIARDVSDARTALFAVSVFTLTPLFSQNAAGGGFAILNLVMLLSTIWLSIEYLKEPSSKTLLPLCFSALLLSQTRYESLLFVLFVVVVVLLGWRRSKRIVLPYAAVGFPLLFVSIMIHLQLPVYDTSWWQLPNNQDSVFSGAYFFHNLGGAVAYFFSLGKSTSANPLFSALGIVAISLVALQFMRKRWERSDKRTACHTVGIFLLAIVTHFGLILVYHAGDLTDPTASRFALPMMVAFTLSLALVLKDKLYSRPRLIGSIAFIACSVYLFSVPIFAKQALSNSSISKKRTDWVLGHYRSHPKGDYLLVIYNPWPFMLHQIPVTHLKGANEVADKIAFHLTRGSFNKIFVVQDFAVDPIKGNKRFHESNYLDSRFQLEEIDRLRLFPYEFASFSILVNVDLDNTDSTKNNQNVFRSPNQRPYIDPKIISDWYRNLF